MNTYLLSYNPLDQKVSSNQLLAYVRDNRHVQQYFQPWLGTYIVKSDADLETLSKGLIDFFSGTHFVVAQIYGTHVNGLLDNPLWAWMNFDVLPTLPGSTGKLPSAAPS